MSTTDTAHPLNVEDQPNGQPDGQRTRPLDDRGRPLPGDTHFASVLTRVCGPARAPKRSNMAVLRRALTYPNGPGCDPTAMRVIGAAVSPKDSMRTVTAKVGVASLFAHHSDHTTGTPWRTPGAVLAEASSRSSAMRADRAGRDLHRLLQTTDMERSLRLLHRMLSMCAPLGANLDWGLLVQDLIFLTGASPAPRPGRDPAAEARRAAWARDRRLRVRSRWARDFASLPHTDPAEDLPDPDSVTQDAPAA